MNPTRKQKRQEHKEEERTRGDTPVPQESQWTCEDLQRWQKEDVSSEQFAKGSEGSKLPARLGILRVEEADRQMMGTTRTRW